MKVVTQKKENKEYYYLKHSFRNDVGKVITKSKYLGDQIPNNIEKIKENFYHELYKENFDKLNNIKHNFQKNWKKIPQLVKEKELEEISISFTYNTNAIEGSTITLSETREILQSNRSPKKPFDEVIETKKHSKVFLESLKEEKDITLNLILDWHKKLFLDTKEEISGKLRTYQVRVGNYYPPHEEELEELLGLCPELNIF